MDLRLPPSGSPSLLSSSSSSPTGNKSQKRKRSADSVLDHEISGWKGSYNSKYHRLLNQTIKDLTLDPLWTDRSDLGPGQVGISRWSPLEKEFLFRGLVSYGRENLPAIATLVGSKSELEVHVYLQLLQETNVKLHTYGDKQSLMMGADVPAAIEVSAECCALLEQTADSLALMQQRYEEHQEKKTQPNLWKLDQNATAWVNDCLSKGEEGIVEVRQRLPAAELLDLGRFLELSKKLFMNSDDPGYNFRTFVSRCEKPSILHTAFSDLYSVMLSTTKRIIQSSLIFAMSRLRATQSPYYSHKRAVKVVDVLAALSVLGMEKNAKEHWVKLPRRCKLSIHNHANRTGYEGAMSYHEVESILGRTATTETVLAGESQSEPANSESPEVSLSDTDLVSATSSSQNRTASPKLVLSHSNATSESTPPAKGCDERADEYLEGIDREANRSGELRLWKMLRKEPPPELLSKYPTSKPKSPESYGQYKHDLDDWGGWTNFEPEWETYGFSLLSEDTVENRTRVQSRSAEFLRASGNKRCVGLYQERATSRSPTPRDAIETE
ncbi:MAG: hypothetical protein LQ344_001158 [Seirophora lacunosa]|nr:MAG: hypothetical protein LQ344_001158 [Seirophora lacunosa]